MSVMIHMSQVCKLENVSHSCNHQHICWIIIKEGPRNFSSGHSPHWVNHVYMCLYCIMCIFFLFPHLFYVISMQACFSNNWY
jgi:hypothetical protein